MRLRTSALFTATVFFAALAITIQVSAQPTKDQIITFDAPGSLATVPASINPSGDITGYYVDASNNTYHGFVRVADGTIMTFDAPDAGTHGTFPVSVNPSGEITGYYYGESVFITHGFLRNSDGTFTSFDVGPNTQTFPASINPGGEITGWYSDAGFPHGFLRAADGTITTFVALGPNAITVPTSINPSGEITGSCNDASGTHGFVRDKDGTITTFDAGPNGTSPTSIKSGRRDHRILLSSGRLTRPPGARFPA